VGNNDIDEILLGTRFRDINNYIMTKNTDPLDIYVFNKRYNHTESYYDNYDDSYESRISIMNWVPYSKIMNLERLAEGGFGIIYKTILSYKNNKIVALKRLKNSQKLSKEFLSEVIYSDVIK
jgi:hypothetical protein